MLKSKVFDSITETEVYIQVEHFFIQNIEKIEIYMYIQVESVLILL